MPTIYIPLQKSLQTVVAIANDRICLILSAISLHECNLFFLRMIYKFSFGLFYVMFGSKLGILNWLFPI